MASIIQAATWMSQGKKVRRPNFFRDFSYKAEQENIDTTDGNIEDEPFTISDLLAEDWEISE